jgi:ligand-binding SRPBCC domain-containing protein
MKLHRFEEKAVIPATLAEAWAFFTDPRNLRLLTPGSLGLRITSELAPRMHPGMIIAYTVRPFGPVRVNWVTEITHVVDDELFVDEQRAGPYRFWHHQHHFRVVPGGVEVRDVVHYALPLGPFGNLAAPFVRRRLRAIFRYRRDALARRFGPVRPAATAVVA